MECCCRQIFGLKTQKSVRSWPKKRMNPISPCNLLRRDFNSEWLHYRANVCHTAEIVQILIVERTIKCLLLPVVPSFFRLFVTPWTEEGHSCLSRNTFQNYISLSQHSIVGRNYWLVGVTSGSGIHSIWSHIDSSERLLNPFHDRSS